MPSSVRNPRSAAQRAHRNRFAVANSVAASFKEVYTTGYGHTREKDKSGYALDARSAFVRHIYRKALDGDSRLDPMMLQISSGTMPRFAATSVRVEESRLTLRWSMSGGGANDRLRICLYNYTQSRAKLLEESVSRRERHTTVMIPQEWEKDHVYVYCFWQNPEGTKVGNSEVVAQTNVPEEREEQEEEMKRHLYNVSIRWKRKFVASLDIETARQEEETRIVPKGEAVGHRKKEPKGDFET